MERKMWTTIQEHNNRNGTWQSKCENEAIIIATYNGT